MLGIFPRLGEVRIRSLNPRILVAMPELLGEAEVAVVVVLFFFPGVFGAVRIVLRNLRHSVACFAKLRARTGADSQLLQPLPRL